MNLNKVYSKISRENNATVPEVMAEMQKALDAGYHNPDPAARAYWESIPHKGEKPTVDEFILHLSGQLRQYSEQSCKKSMKKA